MIETVQIALHGLAMFACEPVTLGLAALGTAAAGAAASTATSAIQSRQQRQAASRAAKEAKSQSIMAMAQTQAERANAAAAAAKEETPVDAAVTGDMSAARRRRGVGGTYLTDALGA